MEQSPSFETRVAQSYVGKRVVMPMSAFRESIPRLMQEVSKWLADRGIKPSGSSFLRYLVVDMPDRIDVEVAFPVDALPETDASVSSGTLPAGGYATLTFTGVENGTHANARLIAWIGEQGGDMDCRHTEGGDAFAGRIETLLTDPEAERDQSKWTTQVAIKLREPSASPVQRRAMRCAANL